MDLASHEAQTLFRASVKVLVEWFKKTQNSGLAILGLMLDLIPGSSRFARNGALLSGDQCLSSEFESSFFFDDFTFFNLVFIIYKIKV